MKKLLTYILFLSILIISSCADDSFDYDCTDCTFFYCEVDGEEWTPNCEGTAIGFGCSAIDARFYPHDTRDIYIYIENENRNEKIHLFANEIINVNIDHPLILGGNNITSFFQGNDSCRKHSLDLSNEHSIFLTEIDTIDFIIAGNFAFTGINDCGDKVEVSNGKFRLNYTF